MNVGMRTLSLVLTSVLLILLQACATTRNLVAAPELAYLKRINGRVIAVHQMGQGYPIIVLPGGPSACGSLYPESLQKISQEARLYFLDYRGCGSSDRSGPYSMTGDLEDVETLVASLAPQRPVLLGHSYGGMLAIRYAIKSHSKIAGMILVNAISSSEIYPKSNALKKSNLSKLGVYQEWKQLGDLMAEGKTNLKEEFRYWSIELENHLIRRELIPEVASRLQVHAPALIAMQSEIAQFDVRKELELIEIPVLVTAGAQDIIVLDEPKRIHQLIPQSDYIEFQGSGHMPFVDENKAFTGHVLNWLRQKGLNAQD